MEDLSTFDSIDKTLIPIVQKALEPNEHVIWVGQPDAKQMAKKANLVALILGLTTLGICLFCIPLIFKPVTGNPADILILHILLVGLPIVSIVGTAIVYYHQTRTGTETVYVITSRRALVLAPFHKEEFHALNTLHVENKADGFSNLIFDRIGVKGGRRIRVYGFMEIAESDKVEQILGDVFNVPLIKHTPKRDGDTWPDSMPTYRT